MKKFIPVITFMIVFIASYFITSFCIPGWRIKLEAAPLVIMIETLKSIWPVKALISLVVGGVAGVIALMVCKKRK